MTLTVTPMGWIVVPITVAILFLRPRNLLAWTIYLYAFQAGSVVNLKGDPPIGMAPYYFAAAFAVLYLAADLRFDALRSLRHGVVRCALPLFALAPYGIVSANLFPFVGQGLAVFNERAGSAFLSVAPVYLPLHWSISNLAESVHLLVNVGLVAAMLWHATRRKNVDQLVNAFYWAGVTVVAVGLYQELAWAADLPFPTSLFNSSLVGKQLFDQMIASSIHRLSATCLEPSMAATYLAAWLVFVAVSLAEGGRRLKGAKTMLALGLAALVMTTSTTGYLVIGIMVALLASRVVLGVVVSRRLHMGWASIGGLTALATVLGAIALGDIMKVLDVELLEKAGSASASQRLAVTSHGLHLFLETFGLGAGLGSDRPFSFAVYVLGDLGAVGTLLIVYAIWASYREVHRVTHGAKAKRDKAEVRAIAWAFVANLLAMIAAVPDPTWQPLWVLWGLLLARCETAVVPPSVPSPLAARERGVIGLVPG